MKELKIENERLRTELSKALMNDTKIIEALDKEGMAVDEDGHSYYDTDTHRTLSGI
jgi:cysteinyl-tRNA synthetase